MNILTYLSHLHSGCNARNILLSYTKEWSSTNLIMVSLCMSITYNWQIHLNSTRKNPVSSTHTGSRVVSNNVLNLRNSPHFFYSRLQISYHLHLDFLNRQHLIVNISNTNTSLRPKKHTRFLLEHSLDGSFQIKLPAATGLVYFPVLI